jgi:hypothetical protein
MTGWIKLETKAPPPREKVLIRWSNGDIAVAYYDDREPLDGWWLPYEAGERREAPSHWMPLPKQPKEEPRDQNAVYVEVSNADWNDSYAVAADPA